MIDVKQYLRILTEMLQQKFGSRLLYVGLQGSYLRGEGNDNSDIDIMVILDKLDASDLASYRSIIQGMDNFEKSCGFICSQTDLKHWNPLEICNLIHGTKDYFGILAEFVPEYTEQDIRNFIKFSINNLYHELCHRYIHADFPTNVSGLRGTYKAVFFILQNLQYLRTGKFILGKTDLVKALEGNDRAVLDRAVFLNNDSDYDFEDSFELLLSWCQETLVKL